jgi:hypothetical protein
MYGRSQHEWAELLNEGYAFLQERARLGKDSTYTEMNAVLARRTGQLEFDFGLDRDRAAMGQLLGDIVARDRPTSGVMISALVLYLNENDAGPGFYRLAQNLGVLSRTASTQQKWDFWVQEVVRVHAAY